jgi:hypothetical protein
VRSFPRAIIAGLAGAAFGAIALVVLFSNAPTVVFDMDRQPPPILQGLYPVERGPIGTFAWSRDRVHLQLVGLDRRVDWTCVVRFRGGRPVPEPQPAVSLAVDGVRTAGATATNEYQDLEARAAARTDRSGLAITMSVDPVFVPGAGDTRQLGVQIDRLSCQSAPGAFVLPPRSALTSAMLAAALAGAAAALSGLSFAAATGLAAIVAVLQALPLGTGPAPYGQYPGVLVRLALWIFAVLVVLVWALSNGRRRSWTGAARFVMAFSAAVVFLKLAALLHPLKSIIDARFHANRLEWVMDGRFFFTQPMPSGVSFPYAIALYVFAAPWAMLANDRIALLRIIVCVAEGASTLLLYPIVVGATGNRRAAVLAVVLFHFIPLPYIVAGNANLTYAFGESAALVTLAALVWYARRATAARAVALFATSTWALLSHVGVFTVLTAKLLTAGALLFLSGGAARRRIAVGVVAATAAAAIVSTAVYYGHFREVYQTLDRALGRTPSTASAPARPTDQTPDGVEGAAPIRGLRAPTIAGRVRDDAASLGWQMGWGVCAFAAAGLWVVASKHRGDPLTVALFSWLLAYAGFVAFAVLAPVEPRFQRYTTEFVSRMNYSIIPAVAILAGCGAAWLWSRGLVARAGVIALVAASAFIGLREWAGWFQWWGSE